MGFWLDPSYGEELQITPNPSIQDFQNRLDDVKPYDFDAPPQGMVRSITFAEGFDEVMGIRRSHEIVPVNIKDTFGPESPVYVVFSIFPHYESFQLFGRCYPEEVRGLDPTTIVAEDAMYFALEDESGYFKLHPPTGGWKPGRYKVEIHVGWKINDISLLGTMRFRVDGNASTSDAAPEPKHSH
jgi:hypothetical protein